MLGQWRHLQVAKPTFPDPNAVRLCWLLSGMSVTMSVNSTMDASGALLGWTRSLLNATALGGAGTTPFLRAVPASVDPHGNTCSATSWKVCGGAIAAAARLCAALDPTSGAGAVACMQNQLYNTALTPDLPLCTPCICKYAKLYNVSFIPCTTA